MDKKNPISISTGFLYLFTNDRNLMIKKLKKFKPDGIELSFADPKHLINFKISEENLDYLNTLQFNSIHSPWINTIYGENEKSKIIVEKIKELYKKINAKNIVFHEEQIEDFNIIKDLIKEGYIASVENDDWEGECNSIPKLKNILSKNPELKFTFDFAHAYSISPDEIPNYIKELREKTVQIHLSILKKDLRTHRFLHKFDNNKNQLLIKELKKTNVPLVLECVALKKSEISLIKKEMNYINKTLNHNSTPNHQDSSSI